MSRNQRKHVHIISIWGDFKRCPYSVKAKNMGMQLQEEGHEVNIHDIPINLFRTLKSNSLTIESTEDMLREIPPSAVAALTMPVIKVDGKWMKGGSEEFLHWEKERKKVKPSKARIRSKVRTRSKARTRPKARKRSKSRTRSKSKRKQTSRRTKSRSTSRSLNARIIKSLIRK